MNARKTEMTADRALQILDVLRENEIPACVDGGWGVDALLGDQTRVHEDLDLVVALDDVDRIASTLGALGFSIAEDHLPVRFVMRDEGASQLDFHTVTFDEEGGGVQSMPGGASFRYPPEGFVRGQIGGREVSCLSADVQILCHVGYEPSDKDRVDVESLCARFALDLPPVYQAEATDRKA